MFNFFKKKKVTSETNKKEDIYIPIIIGGAYIFDPLGESNQSIDTTAVTVIKKGTHDNSYIVLSINNGNVFECDRKLLVPVADYNDIAPLIRIQYGVTDITKDDYNLCSIILSKVISIMKDNTNNADMIAIINNLDESVKKLSEKLKKYSDITEYKYKLETIVNLKKHQQNHFDTKKALEDEETERQKTINQFPKDKIEKYQKDVHECIHESPFYDKFNEITREYLNPFKNIYIDDFIEKAEWVIKDEFPIKALIPPSEELKSLTYEDIEYEKKLCAEYIQRQSIVFLIGANSLGEKKVISIYDMDDFELIEDFLFNECYDGWKNKKLPYKTEYHVVMINVPNKEKLMSQYPPFFNNNEEEENYD